MNCGELRVEHYGAVTENKCVKCAAVERRTLAKVRSAGSPSPRQTPADNFVAESRRQIRIKTVINGHIENRNGARDFNLLDVSRTGAKLQTEHEFTRGTVTLIFPGGGRLHATLAWRAGVNAGVTFIESQSEVIALMGKIKPPLEPMLRAA